MLLVLCLLPVLGQGVSVHPSPSPPITTVAQGQLRGRWFVTRGGRPVAGYLGIPYAAPPIGPLRFSSPEPAQPWMGEYLATRDPPACMQTPDTSRTPLNPSRISEDCLYLNVFTPQVKYRKLPVLVFIHGGSFVRGSGSSLVFGPDYLLDEDIILVTINYRLGILGFMSLEHPLLPGNLGLKDQRAALRWVKDNIEEFGGDADKITIFGEGAGAASVHYHLLFSADEELFRAGIASSGSARCPWAFQRSGAQKPVVEDVVRATNCPREPDLLLECLRQVPAHQLESICTAIERAYNNNEHKRRSALFAPMVEPECVADALVTNNPWNLTSATPLLLGLNRDEGLLFTVDYDLDKSYGFKYWDLEQNYKDVFIYNFFLENTADNPEKVATKLRRFYFGDEGIIEAHYTGLVDLFSDALYTYGVVSLAQSNKADTYFYQLNYVGTNTVLRYQGSREHTSVSHEDDLFFLFPLGGPEARNVTEADTRFSKDMVKMWTNFVKIVNPISVGRPTEWQPVCTPTIEYLDIGQFSYNMEGGFLKRRMDFWKHLHFLNKLQEGRPPCFVKTNTLTDGEEDEEDEDGEIERRYFL